MDWLDYREKLGIGFKDDQKFRYFLAKIFNVLRSFTNVPNYGFLSTSEYQQYCMTTGISFGKSLFQDGNHYQRYNDLINLLERNSSYLEEFLAHYIAFVNSLERDRQSELKRDNFIAILTKILEESHIQYELIESDGECFVFPKGVAEFDDALVSQPLSWLKAYPGGEKAWCKALRMYAKDESENASDVADLFRKALEAFFQEFFAGGKTLENYKSDYGAYLKTQGVPSSIANNFETLLQAYTNYMNDYAKHHDATSDKVLEYLMYQTGNIMRLLITLKQGNSND